MLLYEAAIQCEDLVSKLIKLQGVTLLLTWVYSCGIPQQYAVHVHFNDMTICEIMSNNILLFKNFWSEDKKLAKKQCQEMPSGKTILLFSSFYHFLK